MFNLTLHTYYDNKVFKIIEIKLIPFMIWYKSPCNFKIDYLYTTDLKLNRINFK